MRDGTVRTDVEEFLVARSDRLLRTAYLLTGDLVRAEDLLQEAVTRVWADWDRSELGPDDAALVALVRRHDGGWPDLPRRHRDAALQRGPTGGWRAGGDRALAAALLRLSRRERSVVVLRLVVGLSVEDTACAVGCSPAAVRRREDRAVAALAGSTREPADLPASLTALAAPLRDRAAAGRWREIEHRRRTRVSRHRAEAVGALVLAVVALVWGSASVAHPPAGPPRSSGSLGIVPEPPVLAGRKLPVVVRLRASDLVYGYSTESVPGTNPFRVVVPASEDVQAVVWSSPPELGGQVVVSLDGSVVSRGRGGRWEARLLPDTDQSHTIVLRATDPDISMRLGVAVYR